MFLYFLLLTGNSDYLDLEPGSFSGDDIFIVDPGFRGCAQLTVIGDVMPEGNETLQLRLVTDMGNPNIIVNANFVFDPNVTEVIIINDDGDIPSMCLYIRLLYSGLFSYSQNICI